MARIVLPLVVWRTVNKPGSPSPHTVDDFSQRLANVLLENVSFSVPFGWTDEVSLRESLGAIVAAQRCVSTLDKVRGGTT